MSFRELLVEKIEDANCVFAGICYDKSASIGSGARLFPKYARELSEFLPPYTMSMKEITLKLYDYGDFTLAKTTEAFASLSCELKKVLDLGKFSFFFGGDHSVAISSEKAFIDSCIESGHVPVLFHLDAHADICDSYQESKLSHACPVKRAIDNGIETSNVVLFGIRSYERQEVEYLNAHKEIKVFSASDINNNLESIKKYISKFKDPKYRVHISFDIDMLDPAYAPGTGTPEAFGVKEENALELLSYLVKDFNTNSFDLVEVSPLLDINNITSFIALKILYELFAIIQER